MAFACIAGFGFRLGIRKKVLATGKWAEEWQKDLATLLMMARSWAEYWQMEIVYFSVCCMILMWQIQILKCKEQLRDEENKRQETERKLRDETSKRQKAEKKLRDETNKRQEAEEKLRDEERKRQEAEGTLRQEQLKRKRDALDIQGSECTWQFQADDMTWVSFSPEVNQQLIAAYARGENECSIVIGGVSYREDFADMFQTRQDTKKRRKIQCTFSLPAEWQQRSPEMAKRIRSSTASLPAGSAAPVTMSGTVLLFNSSFEAVAVPMASKEQSLLDLMKETIVHDGGTTGTCSFGNLKVEAIYHIENLELFQAYSRRCRLLGCNSIEKFETMPPSSARANFERQWNLSQNINEKVLFHGTSPETAKEIAVQGFDCRMSLCSFYGHGVYFASQACKSMQYGGKGSQKAFIVSRVALGDPFFTEEVKTNMRRPPSKHVGGPLYDCVIAKPGNKKNGPNIHRQVHWEYIVFEKAQAYPEYIIFYS